jgi:hypothetical protein
MCRGSTYKHTLHLELQSMTGRQNCQWIMKWEGHQKENQPWYNLCVSLEICVKELNKITNNFTLDSRLPARYLNHRPPEIRHCSVNSSPTIGHTHTHTHATIYICPYWTLYCHVFGVCVTNITGSGVDDRMIGSIGTSLQLQLIITVQNQ